MIKKVLFGAAVVLISATPTATPVGADPSLFGVLHCDCDGSSSFLHRGPTVGDQIDNGIENGLADLLGDGG